MKNATKLIITIADGTDKAAALERIARGLRAGHKEYQSWTDGMVIEHRFNAQSERYHVRKGGPE